MNDRRPWFRDEHPLVFDIHYDDGTIKRAIPLSQPLEVGEQIGRGRWVVEQVVPSPDARIDFEAFVRRVGIAEVPPPILNYLVIKLADDASPAQVSYRGVGLLVPGDTIWCGIERLKVRRVLNRGALRLFDGLVVATRDEDPA